MFLDDKAHGEPQPRYERWPAWLLGHQSPQLISSVLGAYHGYVVLPQPRIIPFKFETTQAYRIAFDR